MRLTLRTLLAYLDDTLDAEQVKTIGQKVAESDTAQELIARIKQVTRRRRLTTPPENGPGGRMDPNTIADYLDNELSEDKIAEVEQTCLGSDVHLAEVAACHQILTLILGEPALIPPTSRQRMYGLVKGREAIPFRKPPEEDEALGGAAAAAVARDQDTDETLRMGLPALGRRSGWRERLPVIGGGLAAVAVLSLAIFFALQGPRDTGLPDKDGVAQDGVKPAKDLAGKDGPAAAKDAAPPPGKDQVAAVTPKDGAEPRPSPPVAPEQPAKDGTAVPPKDAAPGADAPKDGGTEKPPPTPPAPPVVPVTAPAPGVVPAGQLLPRAGEVGPLLQFVPGAKTWRRLDAMQADVTTGARVVALPGFQGTVVTKNGVQVKFWGLLPEQIFFPTPIRESVAELHPHDVLDLDLTLHRGRILLTNLTDRPAQVRVRLANPTNPEAPETWDVTLGGKAAEVLFEKWGVFSPNEPFYADPKNPDRIGPLALAHALVRRGQASVRSAAKVIPLEEAPGKGYLQWTSFRGLGEPVEVKELPAWAVDLPRPAAELDDKKRKEALTTRDTVNSARDALATALSSKASEIPVLLLNALKSEDAYQRNLVVRAYGGIDDLPSLVDVLEDKRGDVRRSALETLRLWVAHDRDNDYTLLGALANSYSQNEANIVMSLLHDFSVRDVTQQETWAALASYLDHPKLAIRELAGYHLYLNLQRYFQDQPVGLDIRYSPDAPPEVRQAAQQAWMKLIQDGKVPPKLQAQAGGAG